MFWRKISVAGRFPLIRLKQFSESPRAVKNWLSKNTYYRFSKRNYSDLYSDFVFFDPNQTLDYLINNKCSLARFNDGEFDMILGFGIYPPDSDWSQKYSRKLSNEMINVLSSESDKILVAVTPPWYFLQSGHSDNKGDFIESMWIQIRAVLHGYLRVGQKYGDCRLFVPSCSPSFNWEKLRSYLSDKDVIIATGNTKAVENYKLGERNFYVECGKVNAFQKKDIIKSDILACIETNMLDVENVIVLASLGPTAGLLAYDLLDDGVTVWDTGHMFRYAARELK
jgi:hypothetical protein